MLGCLPGLRPPRLALVGGQGDRCAEMANGYGVVDLVVGRTLVDVKLAVEPSQKDVAAWLRQLLGYVLLDRFDTFRFDTVACCGFMTSIDEFGYMELDRRGDELLFQVPTEREEKASVVIVSNESLAA